MDSTSFLKSNIFRRSDPKLSKKVLGIKQEFYEVPRMIKLSRAILCLNCDTIISKKENKIGTANGYCPSCGSKTTRFISKFLNRGII